MKKEFLVHFQRLETSRKALFQKLMQHSDDELNRKRADGGWSAIQVMQHLIQAEMGTLAYLQKKTKDISGVEKSGFMHKVRTLLLKIFLKLPIKFKAPKMVAEVPDYASLKETATQWQLIRATLLQLCIDLPEEAFEKELFRHPLAGRMNILQMLDFFDSHFERHLAQIDKVLAEKKDK